jgi:hypothetical protein
MLTKKWKGLSGVSLVALAALTLAACNDNSSQPGGTTDDTVGQTVPGQAVPGQPTTQGSARVGEVDRDVNNAPADTDVADRLTNELDQPYRLTGRSIETEDGEHLGQITKLVTDEVQNVYAVIEMEDANQTAETDSMVADIDDIDQTGTELVLMSQKADLKPYEPENYKPLGAQTPPPQGQTVQ